jgi:hypothetical protein
MRYKNDGGLGSHPCLSRAKSIRSCAAPLACLQCMRLTRAVVAKLIRLAWLHTDAANLLPANLWHVVTARLRFVARYYLPVVTWPGLRAVRGNFRGRLYTILAAHLLFICANYCHERTTSEFLSCPLPVHYWRRRRVPPHYNTIQVHFTTVIWRFDSIRFGMLATDMAVIFRLLEASSETDRARTADGDFL